MKHFELLGHYATFQGDGHGTTGDVRLYWSPRPSRCVPFIREVSVSPLSAEWGIFPPAKVFGPSGEARHKQLCSFIGLIYLFYVLAGT